MDKEIPVHRWCEDEEKYVEWDIYRYINKLSENDNRDFIDAVERYLQKLIWPSNKPYPKDAIHCHKCGKLFDSISFHEYMDCYNYCTEHHRASIFDFFVDKTAREFLKENGKNYTREDIETFIKGKQLVCKFCGKQFPSKRKRKFCNDKCRKEAAKAYYYSEESKLKRAAERDRKREERRQKKLKQQTIKK